MIHLEMDSETRVNDVKIFYKRRNLQLIKRFNTLKVSFHFVASFKIECIFMNYSFLYNIF